MSRFQFHIIKWALKQWKKMRLQEMNKPIIIDGVDVLEERKFLIHTDKYSIGEDGLIDNTIPLTDICYDLALQLQRLKAENEQYKQALEEVRDYILDNSDFDKSDCLQSSRGAYDILKIVDKVLKDEI